MLLFTKNSVKVLGGSVPGLYGGNMLKELESRFRAKLGLSNEPVTPTPTPNRAHPPSTSTTNNANGPSSSTARTAFSTNSATLVDTPFNPQLADELNDLNNMDMNAFDDDMDMDMTMMESTRENIPFIPDNNIMDDDDDDDFVMTQAPPPPPPIPRTSLSTSTTSTTTTTNRKKTTAASSTSSSPRAAKRKKVSNTAESMEIEQEEEPLPGIVKQEKKEPEVVEEVHWLSWSDDGDDVDDDEGVELDKKGRSHISFEKLSEVLKAMDNNSYTGKIADVVVVKAKFLRLAKIKYSTLSGFYVIFDIASPKEEESSVVKVVVSHKVNRHGI